MALQFLVISYESYLGFFGTYFKKILALEISDVCMRRIQPA